MKKLGLAILLASMSLMAADYSQLSMDELTELRSTVAVEDREDFRAEMQSRVEVMTPEEQTAFKESRQADSGTGNMYKGAGGQGAGQGLQDGTGAGTMSQGANGRRGGNR